MDEGPPFSSSAVLQSWLDQHGIGHIARLGLEAVAAWVPHEMRSDLHTFGARRFLIELADEKTLRHTTESMSARLRDALAQVVWAFIERERKRAAKARDEVSKRLELPDDENAHELYRRLLLLRQTFDIAVAPWPDEALCLDLLQVDTTLPGFIFRDPLPSQLRTSPLRFEPSKVTLKIGDTSDKVSCTCGWTACTHALAAIDTALKWLWQAAPDRKATLRELTRTAWERRLVAMQEMFETLPVQHLGAQVLWTVEVADGERVEVAPWVRQVGKRGQLGTPSRKTGRSLLTEHDKILTPQDIRAAELCPVYGDAPRALLEALIGHPHVVRQDNFDRAVWIERVPVGLVAQDRQGWTWVSAAVDGVPLPPGLIARIRSARRQDVLFLFDGQRLSLLDLSAELRGVLDILERDGNLFPPEGRQPLVQALAGWTNRIPVAMPRSVLGELVQPNPTSILRLQAYPNGAVHLELRLRPLPESGTYVPGEGATDVHVRRGTHSIHAVRSFEQEVATANHLVEELALERLEPLQGKFCYRLATPHEALALVAEVEARALAVEYEWIGRPLRVVANAGPGAVHIDIGRRRNWFGVLGGLSVQGEQVELARLLDATRRQLRFVEVSSHTYVELTEALRQHLERLSDHVETTTQGLRVGFSALPDLLFLETAGARIKSDEDWQRLKENIQAAQALEPEVPQELNATLRPYQVRGYCWLMKLAAWGAGGVLADDMGLGKTLQALAFLLARSAKGPALVLAPTSTLFNWKHEARRFAPSLRVVDYANATDRAHMLQTLGRGDVLLLSYGLLTRDIDTLRGIRFASVVFDEAQNLKNPKARRTRAAFVLTADAKIALSGTPFENHLGELWSLFSVVFPDLLGSWTKFRRHFALPIEKVNDPKAGASLSRLLSPFMLRRTKAEVAIELPPRTEVRVPVVLSADHWRLYEDARLAVLSDLETDRRKMKEQQRRVEVLAALTRLRLLVCHPRLYDEHSTISSSKLLRFVELAKRLVSQGQRALVFSQFTSHLALVKAALDEAAIASIGLDGQTPSHVREERVQAFQDGQAPLFLISLKAGGVGLNLTAASNVILLDPWWNPAVEDQASDRAHRIGQQEPVVIYRLFCVGTIEEQMLDLHKQKRLVVERILSGAAALDAPSTQDLIDLLAGHVAP